MTFHIRYSNFAFIKMTLFVQRIIRHSFSPKTQQEFQLLAFMEVTMDKERFICKKNPQFPRQERISSLEDISSVKRGWTGVVFGSECF